jgi:glutathione S-transferase
MYTLYGMSGSGNCYKPKLLLAHLGEAYRWIEVDTHKGETHTSDYLALNANGKVPLLQLADGRCLAESNAILCYLAEGTAYLSQDRWQHAQTMQWLFFEQYSHEPYIAVARHVLIFLPADHPRRAELPRLHERGYTALGVMEKHLTAQSFFSGQYGIADIALYAYTHVADEGGFDLGAYPAVRAWLARVRAQPGYASMH